MHIIVGSANPRKIDAAVEAFRKYYPDCTAGGVEVDSGVSRQPKSFEEIIRGATNRARAAFGKCDFSVGLEAGIFPMPGTISGYMDTVCCVIWNGRLACIGFGPAFEFPASITKRLLTEDTEAAELMDELAKTSNIKHKEGAIGFFSKGQYTRQEMMRTAVMMALFPIINKEHYQ